MNTGLRKKKKKNDFLNLRKREKTQRYQTCNN